MKFEDWLYKKKNHNSPLGDLARDWIDGGKIIPFTLEYLMSQSPCHDAVKAYKAAVKAWRKYNKNNP